MPDNHAAWLPSQGAAIEIGPAPYTRPRAGEIVVRNRAVAINPLDWLLPLVGSLGFPWIRYPFITGSDVAGDVAEIGSGVKRFKVGDRVLGHAVGSDKSRNSAAEGGFQHYTVLLAHMAAPIPPAMAYENAAVLPLGLSTAACGLFEKDQLGLRHPTLAPIPTGRTLLVWGGSTSVGCNAIQLAVAAGYDVIATASPHNYDFLRRLGASALFDYRSPTVVDDVVKALQGKTIAGALAIGHGSAGPCLDIVGRSEGDKVVSMATPPVSFDDAPTGRLRTVRLLPTMLRFVAANLVLKLKARRSGIRTSFIFGSSLIDNEVGRAIYVDFLPDALAGGRFVAAPDPLVVGRGLDAIPAALAAQKKGVSAQKVVVSL